MIAFSGGISFAAFIRQYFIIHCTLSGIFDSLCFAAVPGMHFLACMPSGKWSNYPNAILSLDNSAIGQVGSECNCTVGSNNQC